MVPATGSGIAAGGFTHTAPSGWSIVSNPMGTGGMTERRTGSNNWYRVIDGVTVRTS